MLRLLVTSAASEGADSIDITQALLVSNSAAGPLKELFTSPLTEPRPGPGVAAWQNLHEDARLSVKITGFSLNASESNSYVFEVVSSVNVLHIECSGTQGAECIVELTFNHSLNR